MNTNHLEQCQSLVAAQLKEAFSVEMINILLAHLLSVCRNMHYRDTSERTQTVPRFLPARESTTALGSPRTGFPQLEERAERKQDFLHFTS